MQGFYRLPSTTIPPRRTAGAIPLLRNVLLTNTGYLGRYQAERLPNKPPPPGRGPGSRLHSAMPPRYPRVLAMDFDTEAVPRVGEKRTGKPLCVDHGYLVQVVTLGIVGVRAVKWLDVVTD